MNKKKLAKSNTDRRIFGVCGGIANYLNWNSTLIRLVWFVIALCFGVGIVAYLAAALILPKEEVNEKESKEDNTTDKKSN